MQDIKNIVAISYFHNTKSPKLNLVICDLEELLIVIVNTILRYTKSLRYKKVYTSY